MTIILEKFQSGRYIKGAGYDYFLPNNINDQWIWTSQKINRLNEKAALSLGQLNGHARAIPDITQFLNLLLIKESVDSSRIEGIQTKIEETLLPEREIAPERKGDWQETTSCIRAINQAMEEIQSIPLSSRLLRNTHKILLGNVRGKDKLPGEFRTSQNWIGGKSPSDAVFVPPSHLHVPDLMGDMEKFLHNQNVHIPILVRIAIAHYQFETIHPFLDGNGRIGRLLIILYLVSKGVIDQPFLYISSWFEKNRDTYYDKLRRASTHHEIIHWIEFFLIGIEQVANNAIGKLKDMGDLKSSLETTIHKAFGRRVAGALKLLHYLFSNPVVSVDEATRVCGITFRPANDLISLMCKQGILREITGHNRNRLFLFDPYLQLL